MSRILFVDDEPRVLEGLENMLFEHLDHWEMAFATSGPEALAACGMQPFDVVVTDMRMAGMDGADLLSEVRRRWPETVRIVLSGQTDAEQMERAMALGHDFLVKPASHELLVNTLQKALALQRSCRSDALRRVAGHLGALPARPNAYARFQEALEDGADVARIATLLEGDPALVAGLLRVVNSAFFGASRRIDRVQDAVVRLGLDHTAAIVLALCAYEELAGRSRSLAAAIFAHCTEVAQIVRRVAPAEIRSQAYLAGLLHDVGYLVMAGYFVELTPKVVDGAIVVDEDIVAEERAALGFDHGHAGAYLMRLWNLDEAVCTGIEHHHTPLEAPPERRAIALSVHAVDRALAEVRGGTYDVGRVVARAREMLETGGRP